MEIRCSYRTKRNLLREKPSLQQRVFEFQEFESGLTSAGSSDTLLEELFVISENDTAFPTTGDGDLKLLAVDGWKGNRGSDHEHFIDGFVLGSMGSDGIAVTKLPVIGGNGAAIGEREEAVLVDLLHGDELAVDEVATVGLQK